MFVCILNAIVLGVSEVSFIDEVGYSSEMPISAMATRNMIPGRVVS